MSSGKVWLIPVRRTLTSVIVPCWPETLIEAGVLGAPTSGIGIALVFLNAGWSRPVVMRPTVLSLISPNQRLPSAPAVMYSGEAFVVGNSPVTAPSVVIRAILPVPDSAIQRLPSGPAAIPQGKEADRSGRGNSSIVGAPPGSTAGSAGPPCRCCTR